MLKTVMFQGRYKGPGIFVGKVTGSALDALLFAVPSWLVLTPRAYTAVPLGTTASSAALSSVAISMVLIVFAIILAPCLLGVPFR